MPRLTRSAVAATAALAATLLYTANGAVAAKPMKAAKVSAASVSQAKALLTKYRCNGCHGPNLAGREGFSPSIKRTGALHDYSQAQFVTLMHTGMKNDGKHVGRPMPVYATMPTTQAVALYKYLWTLK